MKKLLSVVLVVVLLSSFSAQAQKMRKGDIKANFGLGLVGLGLNASVDYGLVDKWGPGLFTVGAYVGFETWSYDWGYAGSSYSYRQTDILIGPRATYRYSFNDKFEVYGAAVLGPKIVTYKYEDSWGNTNKPHDNSVDVGAGVNAGCRYNFSKSLSVFAETGVIQSALNGGLSLAF